MKSDRPTSGERPERSTAAIVATILVVFLVVVGGMVLLMELVEGNLT